LAGRLPAAMNDLGKHGPGEQWRRRRGASAGALPISADVSAGQDGGCSLADQVAGHAEAGIDRQQSARPTCGADPASGAASAGQDIFATANGLMTGSSSEPTPSRKDQYDVSCPPPPGEPGGAAFELTVFETNEFEWSGEGLVNLAPDGSPAR
jgi:hypothetical protein